MFGRLVQKEFLHHLLDLRFIGVFAFCVLLSGLAAYVGSQNYFQQHQQYRAVFEENRNSIQTSMENKRYQDLRWVGYYWNRKPEMLSCMIYGLSGKIGQEVRIQHRRHFQFEASLFATDPVHALFGVLDLGFIVKVVLSLCMLLFTYDAVCGEKEAGTLRLYASFPVARSTLALAKLVGSTVAVLIPFAFAFLLASVVLALSPELGVRGEDWMRIVALMGVLALYLAVFAGFGIWVSALTHRRMTAFLGLLGLWTIWVFVVPSLATDIAQRLAPVKSVYLLEKQYSALREKIRKERRTEIDAYWEQNAVEDWDALSETRRQELEDGERKIEARWDTEFYTRLSALQGGWRNQLRRQQHLATVLSAVSPLSAVSFVSLDLARTGLVQQERLENALSAYLIYMAQYVQEKDWGDDLTDFSPFAYQDKETLGECLPRNAFHILNLALLAVLGFAGAYVAILRYDVR